MSSSFSRDQSRDLRDWYALLGLSDDATERDLDIAIERLSRQSSALVNTAPERSQQLRDTVRAIRGDLLSGPEARQRYNERVLASRRESVLPSPGESRPPEYRITPVLNDRTGPPVAAQLGPVQESAASASIDDANRPTSSVPNIIDAVASNIAPVASRFRRFLQTGWTCPSCSAEGGPEDQFCKSCGAAMKTESTVLRRRCPQCATEVGISDRFCSRCGTSVT